MVAITGVTMVGLPAQAVVDIMSSDNTADGGKQKPYMVIVKNFLEDQKGNSKTEEKYRQKFMVVLIVSMV